MEKLLLNLASLEARVVLAGSLNRDSVMVRAMPPRLMKYPVANVVAEHALINNGY
jgi:hypothetical protein